jgi:citrate synthase
MKRKKIESAIAWSLPDRIYVKGQDLCADLLGKYSFGDMAFFLLMDRLPNRSESMVFNAIAVTLMEHGLTPSAIVAQLTIAGAPEAMQAAVAAGLSGLGNNFVGSMEGAARLLQEAPGDPDADLRAVAERIVADYAARRQIVPGVGHPFHVPVDPRAPRLFEIARENGLEGRHCTLMRLIADALSAQRGKPIGVNATGAIAAVASEIGIPWKIVRGIGVMARAAGLIGHIKEELENPIAGEIMMRAAEEAESSHAIGS